MFSKRFAKIHFGKYTTTNFLLNWTIFSWAVWCFRDFTDVTLTSEDIDDHEEKSENGGEYNKRKTVKVKTKIVRCKMKVKIKKKM